MAAWVTCHERRGGLSGHYLHMGTLQTPVGSSTPSRRVLGPNVCLLLMLALSGCSTEVGGTPAPGEIADMPGVDPPAGAGGTPPVAGPTVAGDELGDPSTCIPGLRPTSQLPRLLNRQYDASVRDLLGVTGVGPDNAAPSAALFADFDGQMNADAWRLYQDVAAQIAAQVMTGPNRDKFISCDPAAAGCLTETIQSFGRKAFRRPLTPEEVARFERLSQTTPPGTPEEVAETTLLAFLVSPSFLLATEFGSEVEGAAFKLSSHEVAQRLALLLWDSVPDDELNAAADANQLQSKEQILTQAQRMIAVRDKTGPLISNFHRKWLQMDNANSHWWKIQHDPELYPLYSTESVPDYASELDRFFDEVAFNGGSFSDLFLSNIGFVNNATAEIYGLDPTAYGPELTRVELDPQQRPGFLTRVGFLQSFSHFDATSPILRGAFITVNMIGVDPGPPSPEALQVPLPEGDFSTEREVIEALTSPTACSGCHAAFINPPGFVLERYDAIGAWQETDPRGGSINPTATVTFGEGNVKPISSPLELMQEIGQGPLARRIYAENWVSFATGRPPNSNDACLVDLLDSNLATPDYGVLDLLADLTQDDSFRLRVAEP